MKVVATNKKAYFNYDLLENFEAGVSLVGSEVKSLRQGRVSLKDSYAEVRGGEVFLLNFHISPMKPRIDSIMTLSERKSFCFIGKRSSVCQARSKKKD
jgi:tmRNA-binding protein